LIPVFFNIKKKENSGGHAHSPGKKPEKAGLLSFCIALFFALPAFLLYIYRKLGIKNNRELIILMNVNGEQFREKIY
jgi:hypothetical protein